MEEAVAIVSTAQSEQERPSRDSGCSRQPQSRSRHDRCVHFVHANPRTRPKTTASGLNAISSGAHRHGRSNQRASRCCSAAFEGDLDSVDARPIGLRAGSELIVYSDSLLELAFCGEGHSPGHDFGLGAQRSGRSDHARSVRGVHRTNLAMNERIISFPGLVERPVMSCGASLSTSTCQFQGVIS